MSILSTLRVGRKKVESYYFQNDGLVPNSKLPVLIYRNAVDFFGIVGVEQSKEKLSKVVSKNQWYLDWVASIYRRLHYHSTAHEALVILCGRSSLRLGGNRFGIIRKVTPGDVVLIPAGVGHQRMESTDDFMVFGLYPKGQKWDLQWGWRREFNNSLQRIRKVLLPAADPFFGKNGPLKQYWV